MSPRPLAPRRMLVIPPRTRTHRHGRGRRNAGNEAGLAMKRNTRQVDSVWSLSLDLLLGRALAWVATFPRDAELAPEAHRYFWDRYRRLARYHRAHGRPAKAARLQAKADAHYRGGGGDDGPPYAAAMAMPRPSGFVRTDAVSRSRLDEPDDAA